MSLLSHTVSDEREAVDICLLDTSHSLQKILSAVPKYYQRKQYTMDNKGNEIIPSEELQKPVIGLIAQDVLSFNPACIHTWTNLYAEQPEDAERYDISYHDFTVHLIGAVKELHGKIAELQTQHNEQIAALEAEKAAENSQMVSLLAWARANGFKP